MNQNDRGTGYRFAYDQAAAELERIVKDLEQLSRKKKQVETLMEALKLEARDRDVWAEEMRFERKTNLPHCAIVTRLTVRY